VKAFLEKKLKREGMNDEEKSSQWSKEERDKKEQNKIKLNQNVTSDN
jgi:hypothetical protein